MLWLQADIQRPEIEVRSSPNSGHSEARAGLPILATSRPPEAQNLSLLIPQIPTFWVRLGKSEGDPQETLRALKSQLNNATLKDLP